MKSNLFYRFALIIAVILLAVFCIYTQRLKGGIDLSGGTDLIYQLNVPKGYTGNPATLAAHVIATLKKRVDPEGVHNLVWRVVGQNRIEIQMPLASKNARKARRAYTAAQRQLLAANLQPAQISAAVSQPPPIRAKDFQQLAKHDPARLALLEKLGRAYDRLQAANKVAAKYAKNPVAMPAADVARLANATAAYKRRRRALVRQNIDVVHAVRLIKANAWGTNKKAAAAFNQLITDHPAQKQLLLNLKKAYAQVQKHRGGLDDPAELERLLHGAGVLDFRIAVSPISHAAAVQAAQSQLAEKGPRRARTPPGMRWFEIDPTNGHSLLHPHEYAIGSYAGRHYVLLWNTPQKSLTHRRGTRHWRLIDATLSSDPTTGAPIVPFTLNPIGGIYMGRLTSANLHKPMAILLDNKAIEAPDINSTITNSGEITFGSGNGTSTSAQQTVRSAERLVSILNAGSLPATLQAQPISVQTIGPTLGADNLRAGLRSAVIAVIVVMGFMLVYYTITGAFADIALMINLILLLGSMALIHATFTLPGIAGVVLTLGMAVDANVLINERIREELHRGATLWMAVKQGYDKVFWTIFDANLTTSLTSIVLIYVGSQDVKGFGVTLLIGLCIHMFTALFVTRTLMVAAIQAGVLRSIEDISIAEYFRDILTFTWLKGRWPFMRVVTVTNFDWIGKRYYFWFVSAAIMVAGITAFLVRGKGKYDTEFNGGTEVTLHLKRGATMPISQVRRRVAKIGRTYPALRALKTATVEEIGRKHNQFQIVTTIVNPKNAAGRKVTSASAPVVQLQTALENSFRDVLHWTPALAFRHVGEKSADIRRLLDQGVVRPVTKGSLQQLWPGMPNVDLTPFKGGVAVLLQNVQPAVPTRQIQQRIAAMRQEPDMSAVAYRTFKVIPVHYAPGASKLPQARRPVTEAVMVSIDPNNLYDIAHPSRNGQWDKQVAGTEWRIVRAALTTSTGLAGINSFAPQVANEAKMKAIAAVLISLVLIVAYVWIRFGGIRYGFGAIFSLMHDAIVALAATVLSVYIAHTVVGKALLVENFKINLTMIAAYLTIIGYSVNDTIVIFDRIRENRGRSREPLTAKLVNDSINQCFGRTVWTTFTVFIVVLILYVFGGEGVHGFAYAMLIGVFTGAYSTLAIASPMLLHVKEKPAPAPTLIGATGGELVTVQK